MVSCTHLIIVSEKSQLFEKKFLTFPPGFGILLKLSLRGRLKTEKFGLEPIEVLKKNFENVNSKCEKNIKKYNQASRTNSSRHSANTISAVFQPNISRG